MSRAIRAGLKTMRCSAIFMLIFMFAVSTVTAQPIKDRLKEQRDGQSPIKSLANNHIQSTQNSFQVETEDRYLRLMVKVTVKSKVEILQALETQSKSVRQNYPISNYIYELTKGEETVAADFLPHDPFIESGFSDPYNNEGHKISRSKTATIIVNVPYSEIGNLTQGKIGLRLYTVSGNTMPEQLDASTLQGLKTENRLKIEVEFSPKQFGSAVRKSQPFIK